MSCHAGITSWAPFLDVTPAALDELVGTNIRGTFLSAQAGARRMVEQGSGGRLLLTASVTGVRAIRNLSAYAMTRAAVGNPLHAISRSRLGPHRITANALVVGPIVNARNLADDPDYAARWGTMLPVGRAGEPADVGAVAAFLASDASAFITGASIPVDGGWTMTGPVPPPSRVFGLISFASQNIRRISTRASGGPPSTGGHRDPAPVHTVRARTGPTRPRRSRSRRTRPRRSWLGWWSALDQDAAARAPDVGRHRGRFRHLVHLLPARGASGCRQRRTRHPGRSEPGRDRRCAGSRQRGTGFPAGSTVAIDLDGNWKVDPTIGSFDFAAGDFSGSWAGYRVQEQLVGVGGTNAVGRTPDITGTIALPVRSSRPRTCRWTSRPSSATSRCGTASWPDRVSRPTSSRPRRSSSRNPSSWAIPAEGEESRSRRPET